MPCAAYGQFGFGVPSPVTPHGATGSLAPCPRPRGRAGHYEYDVCLLESVTLRSRRRELPARGGWPIHSTYGRQTAGTFSLSLERFRGFGGEEFVVACDYGGAAAATHVAERRSRLSAPVENLLGVAWLKNCSVSPVTGRIGGHRSVEMPNRGSGKGPEGMLKCTTFAVLSDSPKLSSPTARRPGEELPARRQESGPGGILFTLRCLSGLRCGGSRLGCGVRGRVC